MKRETSTLGFGAHCLRLNTWLIAALAKAGCWRVTCASLNSSRPSRACAPAFLMRPVRLTQSLFASDYVLRDHKKNSVRAGKKKASGGWE